MPMACGLVLLGGRDHVRQRHLDAEIDDLVAVIGEDDVDEVLADVMHVALHGGEHDDAALLALDALHHRLQIGDRGFHGLGGLQHEGQLHLAGAEQLAHHLHAVQQDVVDDVERLMGFQRLVQLVGQPLAVAIDDAVLQAALDGLGALLLGGVGGLAVGENLQQLLQRVVALARRSKIRSSQTFTSSGAIRCSGRILLDMHDGAGHAGLHRMVEEHRVQHGAGGRVEAEGDVGEAKDDLDIREFVPDHLDAFQRPQAELAVILIAGGDGEGERVDQQIRLRQAVFVAGEIHQALARCAACRRAPSPCRLHRWSAR